MAFLAFTDEYEQGIYRADGSAVTTIAEESPGGFYSSTGCGSFQLVNNPEIDDLGRVVFRGYTFDPITWDCWEAIYRSDGITTTALTDSGAGGALYSDWSNPSVSPSGIVAIRASVLATNAIGLYTITMGEPTLVLDETDSLRTFSDPDVDGSGTICFNAYDPTLGDGIYTAGSGEATMIASVSNGYFSLDVEPAVAPGGVICFNGEPVSGTEAAYTWNGTTNLIADTDGPCSQIHTPAINSSGESAFYAGLDAGGGGFYTGSDPIVDVVISLGDTLFGSPVNYLKGGRHILNESGQIAYIYELDNGKGGIALATPDAPTTVQSPLQTEGSRSLILAPPFPNPAPGDVGFRFAVTADRGTAELKIFDFSGRHVRSLLRYQAVRGERIVIWDGRDESERQHSSGHYFARLSAGGNASTTRFILVR